MNSLANARATQALFHPLIAQPPPLVFDHFLGRQYNGDLYLSVTTQNTNMSRACESVSTGRNLTRGFLSYLDPGVGLAAEELA